MTFLLLLLIISTSSIINLIIKRNNYSIFKYDNSPVLIFNNKDLFNKVKILKMLLFNNDKEFYKKYILQYIEDNDHFINIDNKSYYSYEPVEYNITKIKSDNKLFLYVIKIFEFLEYMIDKYYIIPFLTDYNIYITKNDIKILLIDFTDPKHQSTVAEYNIYKLIEWLKGLMNKLKPNKRIGNNYNEFLKKNKYILLEKIDMLCNLNKPLHKC